MKVVLAGVFVFGALLGMVAIASALRIFDWLPAPIVGTGFAVFMLLMIVAALFLFNPRGARLLESKGFDEQVRQLEERGLLTEQSFRATRAFGVEEFEDEGVHYYLELADGGGVLFLSGQYLYDYEPARDQKRRFPCSEFVVRRHKDKGYAVDIRCEGRVLEPDVVAPGFSLDAWENDTVPADGTIISTASYDEIKRTRMNK